MIPELIEQGIPPQSIAGQLARELRAAPQIRDLLLRELFTEEFLALPQRVERIEASVNELRYELLGRIDEAESRLNARIDEVEGRLNTRIDEAEGRLNTRIDEVEGRLNDRIDGVESRLNNRIDEAEGRLNARIDDRIDEAKNELGNRIDEAKNELGNRMSSMEGGIRTLQGQVGNLRGKSYEDQCKQRINLVLGDYLDDISLVDYNRIDVPMARARRSGRITRQEYAQVKVIDIIAQGTPVQGISADGQSEALAVVEVSISLNEQDVRNAARRAALIRSVLDEDVGAFCVSHYLWSDALADFAAGLGVTLLHHELPGFDIPEGAG